MNANIFSILSLAWMMSFLQSATAQACQNWCASNAAQWGTKCKWRKACGACPACTSARNSMYITKLTSLPFPHVFATTLLLLLCLQIRPLPLLQTLEYVISGAVRILNRGQRNARGRLLAAGAPHVVGANVLLSLKSRETFCHVLICGHLRPQTKLPHFLRFLLCWCQAKQPRHPGP